MMASFNTNTSDLRNWMVHLSGTMQNLGTSISDLRNQMVHVNGIVQDLVSIISTQAKTPLSRTANPANPSRETCTTGLTLKILLLQAALSTAGKHNTAATAIAHLSPWASCHNISSISVSNNGKAVTTPLTLIAHSGRHTGPSPSMSTAGTGTGRLGAHTTSGHQKTSSSCPLPTAGLFIPDVPMCNSDGSCYLRMELCQDIVKHWTEGDPALILHTALRDWPPKWT